MRVGMHASLIEAAAPDAGVLSLEKPIVREKRIRRKIKIPSLLRYKRYWCGLLIPLSMLITHLAGKIPYVTEYIYAQQIYPVFSTVLGFLTSLIHGSIAEILILILPLMLITYLVFKIVQICRKKDQRKKVTLELGATLLCIFSVTVFSFTLFCGINYNRLTFAELYNMNVAPSSAEELEQLCVSLVIQANTLRQELPQDENGMMGSSFSSYDEAAKFAQSAYSKLGEQYPVLSGYTPCPKPVMMSKGMSSLNITGIYSPFTFEANVNTDVLAYSIPATMMHELSHFKGFMREEEANFIAYLACRESGNTEFYYSGSMLALQYSLNALYKADPDRCYSVIALLSDEVTRDRAANRAYWAQYDTPIAAASSNVNDVYLKSNRQASGVQSYGQMVDLLLAEFEECQTLAS